MPSHPFPPTAFERAPGHGPNPCTLPCGRDRVHLQVLDDALLVRRLRGEIADLKRQVTLLTAQLADAAAAPRTRGSLAGHAADECDGGDDGEARASPRGATLHNSDDDGGGDTDMLRRLLDSEREARLKLEGERSLLELRLRGLTRLLRDPTRRSGAAPDTPRVARPALLGPEVEALLQVCVCGGGKLGPELVHGSAGWKDVWMEGDAATHGPPHMCAHTCASTHARPHMRLDACAWRPCALGHSPPPPSLLRERGGFLACPILPTGVTTHARLCPQASRRMPDLAHGRHDTCTSEPMPCARHQAL
eukprot:363588-Chlamydomonas_euryale.AAC.2